MRAIIFARHDLQQSFVVAVIAAEVFLLCRSPSVHTMGQWHGLCGAGYVNMFSTELEQVKHQHKYEILSL